MRTAILYWLLVAAIILAASGTIVLIARLLAPLDTAS